MKTKVIAIRFIRAFVAGALATGATITLNSASTWTELGTALSALSISLIIGGVNGILMAGDKLFRWKE